MNLTDRIEHVNRVAVDYSDEERTRFREIFAPRALRYRCYSRLSVFVACSAFILWMAAIRFLPGLGIEWICGVLFLGLLALILYGWFSQPSLECPACHNAVDSRQLGRYCPECGSGRLSSASLMHAPKCGECGAVMRRGKSRGYSIRACTHCGVILDDKGV